MVPWLADRASAIHLGVRLRVARRFAGISHGDFRRLEGGQLLSSIGPREKKTGGGLARRRAELLHRTDRKRAIGNPGAPDRPMHLRGRRLLRLGARKKNHGRQPRNQRQDLAKPSRTFHHWRYRAPCIRERLAASRYTFLTDRRRSV